jgi:hypothetical protein
MEMARRCKPGPCLWRPHDFALLRSEQGKKNRFWMERVAGTDTLILEFRGGSREELIHASFNTTGIPEALAAAGCNY